MCIAAAICRTTCAPPSWPTSRSASPAARRSSALTSSCRRVAFGCLWERGWCVYVRVCVYNSGSSIECNQGWLTVAALCRLQAMDEDQDGETVEWKKVFEEDREFNQGWCSSCSCVPTWQMPSSVCIRWRKSVHEVQLPSPDCILAPACIPALRVQASSLRPSATSSCRRESSSSSERARATPVTGCSPALSWPTDAAYCQALLLDT